MLKKYAKRFSRSVMGGLGPGCAQASIAAQECVKGGGRATTMLVGHKNPALEISRWPPHSRKVIDDEEGTEDPGAAREEEEEDEQCRRRRRISPLNAKRCDRVCKPHLSSCSSNATSTSTEEGFGSESSLEELRMLSQMQRRPVQPAVRRSEGKLVNASSEGDLAVKSSSTSTLSSIASSSASDSLAEMVSHLRSTLFYYALVFRF